VSRFYFLTRLTRLCAWATSLFGLALMPARCLSAFAKRPSAFAITSRSGKRALFLRWGMTDNMAGDGDLEMRMRALRDESLGLGESERRSAAGCHSVVSRKPNR
jgi:hypothetical protein